MAFFTISSSLSLSICKKKKKKEKDVLSPLEKKRCKKRFLHYEESHVIMYVPRGPGMMNVAMKTNELRHFCIRYASFKEILISDGKYKLYIQ